jgi:hypothetical protein
MNRRDAETQRTNNKDSAPLRLCGSIISCELCALCVFAVRNETLSTEAGSVWNFN